MLAVRLLAVLCERMIFLPTVAAAGCACELDKLSWPLQQQAHFQGTADYASQSQLSCHPSTFADDLGAVHQHVAQVKATQCVNKGGHQAQAAAPAFSMCSMHQSACPFVHRPKWRQGDPSAKSSIACLPHRQCSYGVQNAWHTASARRTLEICHGATTMPRLKHWL